MKIIFKINTFMIVLFLFTSCKKENVNGINNQSSILQNENNLDNSVLSRISVHSNGYLVFNNKNDLLEFGKLLNSPSKKVALNSVISKGFHQKYSPLSVASKEEEDPYKIIFDQNGLLQVGDILMKISSDEKFFYIVKEQYLDPEVYVKLISEFYDELKMDKINVDRINEDFDLFALIDYTPFGINEPEYKGEEKRPFWGTGTVNHYDEISGCHWTCHKNYMFWIGVSSEYGCTEPSGCTGPF